MNRLRQTRSWLVFFFDFEVFAQVPLTPVYRDPVHDFGLFHFDVTKLRYADELQRAEIPLAEDGAKVGLEIRVVGNDSGLCWRVRFFLLL